MNRAAFFSSFLLFLSLSWFEAQGAPVTPPYKEKVLHRTPDATEEILNRMPMNLAWSYLGTQIEVTVQNPVRQPKPELGPKNLLIDDVTFYYNVGRGRSTFFVTLPDLAPVDRVELLSFGTQGEMQVSVSKLAAPKQSRWWKPVTKKISMQGKGCFSAQFPLQDVRSVKIDVIATKPGRLSSLGIFGNLSLADFRVKQAAGDLNESSDIAQVVNQVDAASLLAGSQVLYVSSSADDQPGSAQRILDENDATPYRFRKDDRTPTLLIAFPSNQPIRRITAYADMGGPGQIQFYLLKDLNSFAPTTPLAFKTSELPSSAYPFPSWPQQVASLFLGQASDNPPSLLQLPASFFNENTPLGVLDLPPGVQEGALTLPTTSIRYLLVRFIPEKEQDILVYEVNAYTDPRQRRLLVEPIANPLGQYSFTTGELFFDYQDPPRLPERIQPLPQPPVISP